MRSLVKLSEVIATVKSIDDISEPTATKSGNYSFKILIANFHTHSYLFTFHCKTSLLFKVINFLYFIMGNLIILDMFNNRFSTGIRSWHDRLPRRHRSFYDL